MPDAPIPKARKHPFKRGDGAARDAAVARRTETPPAADTSRETAAPPAIESPVGAGSSSAEALPISDTGAFGKPFKSPGTRSSRSQAGGSRAKSATVPPYAELSVTSNFTFLTGASHPDEMVLQAGDLNYRAIAITDVNSLAGVVRAHVAAKEAGVQLVVGCRLRFMDAAPNGKPPEQGDEDDGDVTCDDRAAVSMNPAAVVAEPEQLAASCALPSNQLQLVHPPSPRLSSAGCSILVYPADRAAYGRLCTLLTLGKRRAPKGQCFLSVEDLVAHSEGLLAVVMPGEKVTPDVAALLRELRRVFDDDRLSLGLTRLYGANDDARLAAMAALSRSTRVPLVATNDVHYHVPGRRALQDVVTCIRHGCTIQDAGFRLFPNGERYLKPPEEMARLFAKYPKAMARTVEIAERAKGFSLDMLRYEYADEVVPPGQTPMGYLRELTWEGAKERYPGGVPEKVRKEIEHEFSLIDELNYAPYFLTVHDLVRYARSLGILCQGRGAAANSAVCFCLGVTAVDPARIDVLFERFVSRERAEPPDIDIDFEHERREEVIQYIYAKYGRHRAGLTGVVISYRGRSAVRDIGKALGLSLDAVDRLAKRISHWARSVFEDDNEGPEELRELGFNPEDRTMRQLVRLSREIMGFPRHLSQHVGGFVITRGPLCEFVPIENAAMENRTIIEWDKDDIDAMGMLKVDCLGLGMLTCIRKAIDMVNESAAGRARGAAPVPLQFHTIPAEDSRVYDRICDADTVGVFQIESRAQMSMLPRLKPRTFYDLVIEVAIVRPGPIVGDMVHPYLRRRHGQEPVIYPDEKVKAVLGKTLGIPLFQEQAMALAIVAAGFTAGEAEMLRRAITAWKSRDSIERYMTRFINGMIDRGYGRKFAEQCFERLKGFSEYGFPESHAASFALLVYASAWLKCYHPAAFAAALINSQPMGFYAPAQIIRDAKDHGVETRPVDVNLSDWDCTLEDGGRVIRLGLRMVKGLREADARAITTAVRRRGPFRKVVDLWRVSDVQATCLKVLAMADAFGSMGLDRQHALWEVQALQGRPLPLFDRVEEEPVGQEGMAEQIEIRDDSDWIDCDDREENGPFEHSADSPALERVESPQVVLPPVSPLHEVGRDYERVGLSLKAHPVSFIREALTRRRVVTARTIKDPALTRHGRLAAVAGLVLFRQRPATANGVLFMTLEDETGRSDLIIRPEVYERCREAAYFGRIVLARGRVERQGRVVQFLVRELEDIGDMMIELPTRSRDFR